MPPVEAHPAEEELQLLYNWDSLYPPQFRVPAALSVLLHALMLAAVILAPPMTVEVRPATQRRIDISRSTPLYAPRPFELTQRAPNRGPTAKELTLDQLLPQKQQVAKNTPPPRRFQIPTGTAPLTPPPVIAEMTPPPLGTPSSAIPDIAAPRMPTAEKPKLAFEIPGTPSSTSTTAARPIIPKAPNTVDEAVRTTVRTKPGGSVVVTDLMDLPPVTDPTQATPTRSRAGSSLELLSDPQGVDFKPYLIRVLASVKRNWQAVIPEGVKYGQRGRVIIQFAISRQGSVPKLVISIPSGTDSLDRAAVAGISASNPFPPLPNDFKGDQIRLQLSFLYNMPVN